MQSSLGYSEESLTVSSRSAGDSGLRDVSTSLPATLGRRGIIASRLTPPISEEETVAAALRAQMDIVDRQIDARR